MTKYVTGGFWKLDPFTLKQTVITKIGFLRRWNRTEAPPGQGGKKKPGESRSGACGANEKDPAGKAGPKGKTQEESERRQLVEQGVSRLPRFAEQFTVRILRLVLRLVGIDRALEHVTQLLRMGDQVRFLFRPLDDAGAFERMIGKVTNLCRAAFGRERDFRPFAPQGFFIAFAVSRGSFPKEGAQHAFVQ